MEYASLAWSLDALLNGFSTVLHSLICSHFISSLDSNILENKKYVFHVSTAVTLVNIYSNLEEMWVESDSDNMEEVKRALTRLENHSIIQRIDGKFNKGNCKFAILPTVLSVVSADKLNMIVSILKKEENDEETSEDSAG